MTEHDQQERVLVTAEGDRVDLGPEPGSDHRLAAPNAPSPRRASPRVLARATARLYAKDERERAYVRLAGDGATSLRGTLQALLVSGLPAVSASYDE